MRKTPVFLLFLMAAFGFAAERNVIFIISDDESPTLGCYGDPVAVTPAVDALAADGTVFHNAYATTASCSASRSVVMSGLHNHRNGQYGHAHSYHKFDSYRSIMPLTLPRVMTGAGYRTAQIGKYHVAPEEVYHYETYLKGNSRNAVEMAENSKEFITAESDKPFFLYFATSDPHRGGGKDKNFEGKHKPDLFGNKPDKGEFPGVKEVFYDPATLPIPAFLPDSPESRSELAHYYQSCSRIDQGVARLVEILKEAGLFEKTLIVFTADHGMAFPGGKTTVYEGGLRVPFVVRNPYETNRGVDSQALISHIDITPSILDFAGGLDAKTNLPVNFAKVKPIVQAKGAPKDNEGKPPKRYHGKSWIPILGKPDASHWETVFASHTFHEIQMYYPMRVVRDADYKLIWNIAHGLPYPFASDLWAASTWQAQWDKGAEANYGTKTVDSYVNRPAFELYDMKKDPNESNNLAGNPEFAEVLKAYQGRMKEFQIEMEDPWVMKWRYE